MHIYILPLLAFLGPKGRSERPFKVCLDDLDVLGLVLEVLPGAEPLHFGLLCIPVLDLLNTAADLTLTTLGLKIAGNIILFLQNINQLDNNRYSLNHLTGL